MQPPARRRWQRLRRRARLQAGVCRWATAVAAGRGAGVGKATCAALASGKVVCWGANTVATAALGFESTDRYTPTLVPGLSDAVRVLGAGPYCAELVDGRLRCWGVNNDCQLGRGTQTAMVGPFEPLLVGHVQSATMGGFSGLAIGKDGAWHVWGNNASKQHGPNGGSTLVDVCLPRQDPLPIASLVALAPMYGSTVLARTDSGKLYCWGENYSGQCATGEVGSSADVAEPTLVANDAVAAATGDQHACYVDGKGAVLCAGALHYGAVGSGTVASNKYQTSFVATGITDAVDVAAGGAHSCALREGGKVSCWGRNTEGQLGIGDNVTTGKPTEVQGLQDIEALALSRDHSCALAKDGRMWCWGDNDRGQLGNGEAGTGVRELTPRLVPASAAP